MIDDDGTWLVEVPMNLDYVITDEFGNQVLSNDPTKGIPTKGKYRFRIQYQNEDGLNNDILRADYLVPNVREYGWSVSTSDPLQGGGNYNDALKSYSFSLDWNDYVDVQAAINCDDTFYQFEFNKVYTVSGLIDEFKNLRLTGIRRPIISDNISGKFYKDVFKYFFDLDINGKVFPHSQQFNSCNLILTGLISGSPFQKDIFKTIVSGEFKKNEPDLNKIYSNLSGDFFEDKNNNFFGINFSGELTGNKFEQNINKIEISGLFFPFESDVAAINFFVTGYETGKNTARILAEKTGEITSLNYYISSYRRDTE